VPNRRRRERRDPPRRRLPPSSRRVAGQPAPVKRPVRGTTSDPPLDAAVADVLRQRAERLARPPGTDDGSGADVLVCRLHAERYAIDLAALYAVQSGRGLTPVPCTPNYIAGAMNVRGEVVTVLDLAVALGLPAVAGASTGSVLLVQRAECLVGLLVEEVLGIERLDADQLAPTTSSPDFVRGIADGMTTCLDLRTLLADERFGVFEEVN
jgi:purine-binding chemotaxis protein CheW